jgi:hypothetical protein
MSNVKKRSFNALNLKQYAENNKLDYLGQFENLEIPFKRQYILRCLIKEPFGAFEIPESLEWIKPLIDASNKHQEDIIGIKQPFCYVTVRNGYVTSETDDEWHVDGISLNITHLPEQNYCWVNHSPTEYIEGTFNFPKDFSGLKHNIHLYFQDNVNEDHEIKKVIPYGLYCMDPYIFHRRPKFIENKIRTFVRISYTPIEIMDINNTENILLPRNHKRDGVIDYRDNLSRYLS